MILRFTSALVFSVSLLGCATLTSAYNSIASAFTSQDGQQQGGSSSTTTRIVVLSPGTITREPAIVPALDNSARQVDVAGYRTWSPSDRARNVPAAIERDAFSGTDAGMKALVGYLVQGVTDPFLIVKNLHDWEALNVSYDVQAFFANRIPSQEPASVLQTRTAVCAGYAALFQRLATLAGVSAVTIPGYSRGYGFSPFGTERFKENHDWNAVKIGEAWYLLDVTWDSGYINSSRYFREYSNNYFLLAANRMIYTHMPTDVRWQLLDRPLSHEQSLALPYLRGSFFRYAFNRFSQLPKTFTCDTEFSLLLQHDKSVHVSAFLYDSTDRQFNRLTLTEPEPEGTRILVRPPEGGTWTLRVFARDAQVSQYTGVWEAGVRSQEGNPDGYPLTYDTFGRLNCTLTAPLDGYLVASHRYTFDLSIPGAVELLVQLGRSQSIVPAVEPGVFRFDYTPATSGTLDLFERRHGETGYSGILEYQIIR